MCLGSRGLVFILGHFIEVGKGPKGFMSALRQGGFQNPKVPIRGQALWRSVLVLAGAKSCSI